MRANTDPVRFLQAEGPAPEGWTDVGFDDDSWTLGSGPAGFGEAGVSFELPQGRTTYYLRSTFDVTADQIGDGVATIELMFDDGVVVHINGTPVFRDNLPNVVHHMTRAEEFRWGELESRLWNNGINPGVLVAGENVLAIEVHQAHPDSRDLMASVSIRLNN